MFRGALSPHRQPLLDDQQPAPHAPLATTKKPAATSLRNLFFGKEEAQPHDVDEPHTHRNVGSARSRTPSQSSNKIAPDAFAAVTSPPSAQSSKHAKNPRDTFQRAKSQPIRLDASAALSASRTFDPSMSRAAALDPGSFQSQSQRSPGPQHRQSPTKPQTPVSSEPPSLRSTVYGSCSLVLSTVISELVRTIKTNRGYVDAHANVDESPVPLNAPNTVRKAKLLYIALLEKAQKERGEWQGFGPSESNAKKERASSNNHEEQEEQHDGDGNGDCEARAPDASTRGLLAASLQECTKDESFAVLNELLELSFSNLRVALVSPAAYSKHRRDLEAQSLSCPASLGTLLRIGAFVSDLSRDEKRCLLHLLSYWCALCVVDPNHQELQQIVEDKHTLVLSESSEMEFMQHAVRKSAWSDLVAIDLLTVMAHYREMIFSDLEFYTIRQEMQITTSAAEPVMETSQPPSEADSASPETEVLEEPLEELPDDLLPSSQPELLDDDSSPSSQPELLEDDSSPSSQPELLEDESSTSEVPHQDLVVPDEAANDDAETSVATPIVEEGKTSAPATSSPVPSPREPSASHDDSCYASTTAVPPCSTTQSPTENEPMVPISPQSENAFQAAVSPSSQSTVKKLKSPHGKGPRAKAYAGATMVSPRFKRSRLVYPSIHAVAAAVTPRQRRAGGVGAMPLEEVLPYVAVALTAASMGVLATVAFYAAHKSNH